MLTLDANSGPLAEGHRPVAVESSHGIDGDGQRSHIVAQPVPVAEKVAQWYLDRGLCFVVPIDAQNGKAPVPSRRHPDLLDRTGALSLPRGVFVVSSVPFRVEPSMVALVMAVALALAAAASWLPSRMIARREPAEGLRYE